MSVDIKTCRICGHRLVCRDRDCVRECLGVLKQQLSFADAELTDEQSNVLDSILDEALGAPCSFFLLDEAKS